MAISRPAREPESNSVVKALKVLRRASPAAAKTIAMAGQSILAAEKFSAYAYKTKNGLDTPLGVGLSVLFGLGTSMVTIVARGFAMYRSETKPGSPITPITPRTPSNSLEKPIDIIKNSTCCHPGIEPDNLMQDIGYRTLQAICVVYAANTGLSGLLNAFSISELVGRIPGLKFNDTCEYPTEPAPLIIIHLAALFLAYSNVLSFTKTNLLRTREYYVQYIIQKGWRDFTLATYIESGANIAMGTAGIIFANRYTWEALEEKSLCHIGVTAPSWAIALQTSLSVISNLFVSVTTTIPAVHKRRTGVHQQQTDELLEIVTSFKEWHPAIKIAICISTLAAAVNGFMSAVRLPESIHRDLRETDIAHELWMIAIGVISALFMLRCQFPVDSESYVKELEARAKEIQSADNIDNPDLAEPLLTDEEEAREETPRAGRTLLLRAPEREVMSDTDQLDNIHHREEDVQGLPTSDSMYLPTSPSMDERTQVVLSTATSQTLFGTRNPSNTPRFADTTAEENKRRCVIM